MARPAGNNVIPEDRPVSGRTLAGWFDCSRAYISELEGRDVLHRVGGKFPLRASVIAYTRYLRRQRDQDQSPRSEAAAEHHRQKAKLISYQIARHEREHITMVEHEDFVNQVTGVFLMALSALPAHMVGNDLAAKRKWEAYVTNVRQRCADTAIRLAEEAERNDRRRVG